MQTPQESLYICKLFTNIKTELTALSVTDNTKEYVDYLINLCDTYNELSLEEVKQTDECLQKLYNVIKQNKDLPVNYKKELLNILNELKRVVVRLTVDTIISYI